MLSSVASFVRAHAGWLLAIGIVAIVLATAAPAAAILNGQPDIEHPYVGILVTDIDGQRVPVCTGFLVNSTTFVTAAHCVDDLGNLPALVSFDQRFTADSPVVTGTAVPNPEFGSPGSDTHDLALIDLDSPVTDLGYARLPRVDDFVKGSGKPAPDFQLVRTFGDSRISKVEKTGFNLRMQAGICFGDSGGPVFLGDSNLVVGVASFVNNGRCAGNAFGYRLDTAESLDFLAPYL